MTRYIITILFLAVAVVLFFTQTRSYFDKIGVLKEDKATYSATLERSRELQALRDELLNQYNSISQESLDNLKKLLPEQIDFGTLIVMFENKMKAHGFLLKKIDVEESKVSAADDTGAGIIGGPPPPYKTIKLSFLISGPYNNFLELLSDLEKSMRIIDIKSAVFSVGTSEFLEFNISAETYVASLIPSFAINIGEEENSKEGREILAILAKLRTVEINTAFFENEIFRSLMDFAPVLELPQEYGRLNPFSKI